MSSGTDVQIVESMIPIKHEIQHTSSGFQSITDYQRFLMNADISNNFLFNYMDNFFNTTNTDVLAFIGTSNFVGKKTKEAADIALNPWRPDSVKNILKFLKHIPFELTILIDNDLGLALKNIKKAATSNNDIEIVTMSSKLISEWKELQAKSTTNNLGKRDSPERSSASPPTPEAKKFKLAIQKDPPVRPKAIADPNFFPTLGETKKLRRPVYVVDDEDNKIVKNESTVSPDAPVISSPVRATAKALVTTSPNRTITTTNRKRVTFSDKLVEVREYEKNPEEWTSFDNQADELDRFYSSQQNNQVEPPPRQNNIPSISWYQPQVLNFNIEENPSIVIPKLIRTEESASQDRREKIALAAIYTSPQHIPSSPGEPDEVPNPNEDTRVIPLDDINDGYNPPQSQVMTPPTVPAVTAPVVMSVCQPAPQPIAQPIAQPIVNPTLISPETLSALAAAMSHPSLIPQQTYQPAPQPQIIQQPVPAYNQPSYAPQQAEIPSSAVDSLLKNNPGIMNSLKELSFLAGSDSPISQAQPATVNYQQDTSPAPQYINSKMNGGNRYSPNHNNVTRGGGRGGRGRGFKNGSSNRPLVNCAFFNTAEGCRNGVNCPYSHNL